MSEFIRAQNLTRMNVRTRTNIRIENYTNIREIFILLHSREWMSEYIRTKKIDSNECPNIFVKEKLIRTNVRINIRHQYIRIFVYSNIFVTLWSCHHSSSFGLLPPSPSGDDVIYERPLTYILPKISEASQNPSHIFSDILLCKDPGWMSHEKAIHCQLKVLWGGETRLGTENVRGEVGTPWGSTGGYLPLIARRFQKKLVDFNFVLYLMFLIR